MIKALQDPILDDGIPFTALYDAIMAGAWPSTMAISKGFA